MNKKDEKKLKEIEKSIQDLWENMRKLVALVDIQSDVLAHGEAIRIKNTDPKKDIPYIW